ncbi:MAG: deoxyguanosinetriphosphate triphosphohydrolase [Oscillospiraceae bacterium]|jgi:dGTPase|nr:deoxyguanosinetriphosphate triphosphohydrolase [Oscillospiraceae bacterium]
MPECIREQLEKREETLSSFAAKSVLSGGREREEPPCNLRTVFMRDRDRIIHCKAFRRLKHKTQVFLAPEGDHYRTRLTHTLEVYQIADTIARSLFLNRDLTEAVALGHDIGHTPFGHAGERALNRCMTGGFRHFEQSVRIARTLESDGAGLNLTAETLDGILCHTNLTAQTREGQIVRFADRIAYINHDIEDAIRAGVIVGSDIPKSISGVLGNTKSQRINTLIAAVISEGAQNVDMNPGIREAYGALHAFMFERVYKNSTAKGEESKVEALVERLFAYFAENTDKLPPFLQAVREREGAQRAACDYIAGMTDRFALQVYDDLFLPKVWKM